MASYNGPTAALSLENIAQIAYQAGFRGDALWQIVGIAKRESGGDPDAHRSNSSRALLSGDRGLTQINYSWDDDLIQAGIIKQKSDLFDPVTNMKAAYFLYTQAGKSLSPWTMAAGGWNAGGDSMYGVNQTAAKQAVENASKQGLLGSDYSMDPAGNTTPPASLPSDAQIVKNEAGTAAYALFHLNGVTMRFTIPMDQFAALSKGKTVTTVSSHGFWYWNQHAVDGGNAAELSDVGSTYGSFGSFFNTVLDQVFSQSNPARNDPAVLRVIAEFAGRPDMSEAELQNKLKSTPYWQSHTQASLEWNDLSAAEKNSRMASTKAQMAQTWFQFTGAQQQNFSTDEVTKLASGEMTLTQWTEQFVKPAAAKNGESPWSRQVRTEKETQAQRGIDIENTRASVRQQLAKWGLQWSDKKLADTARDLVEKKMSDDDLLETIKNQANQQYGAWKKDKELDTETAASPWIQTYNRVMEKEGTLFTSEVQAALNGGQDAWSFEQSLKKSAAWRETRNGREDMYNVVGQVGQLMGY